MLWRMKMRNLVLLILIMLLGSCSGIEFDPYFARPNHNTCEWTHRDGKTVDGMSKDIYNYAALTKEKIKELAEILKRAKMPVEDKKRYLEILENSW